MSVNFFFTVSFERFHFNENFNVRAAVEEMELHEANRYYHRIKYNISQNPKIFPFIAIGHCIIKIELLLRLCSVYENEGKVLLQLSLQAKTCS